MQTISVVVVYERGAEFTIDMMPLLRTSMMSLEERNQEKDIESFMQEHASKYEELHANFMPGL